MSRNVLRQDSTANSANKTSCWGVGQLSLVEHALCPLDAQVSLKPGLEHHTAFQFTDDQRRRRTARVEVSCPRGLSANDEFYLWGLLALTLRQPQPELEFHATPHYCLRELGLIDSQKRRGGRQYEQFAAAIERLSWARYGCDAFYDPVRAERCRVRFGFFSYRLPIDPRSSRAWRFHWDGQFFEFVLGTGGAMRFDLERYRRLTPAGRRLFLFVTKVFARRESTPRMGLVHLAVDVIGMSAGLSVKHLLAKTRRVCDELASEKVIEPIETRGIRKRAKGDYEVMLHRSQDYQATRRDSWSPGESPLLEPLRMIGLDNSSIARTLQRFPTSMVREWVDITLAARERFGDSFFKRSAAAFLLDNLKHAATSGRTPPDWWIDIRKAEELSQAEYDRRQARGKRTSTSASSREVFDRIRSDIFEQLASQGCPKSTAMHEATRRAQQQAQGNSNKERQSLTSAQEVLDSLSFKFR